MGISLPFAQVSQITLAPIVWLHFAIGERLHEYKNGQPKAMGWHSEQYEE